MSGGMRVGSFEDDPFGFILQRQAPTLHGATEGMTTAFRLGLILDWELHRAITDVLDVEFIRILVLRDNISSKNWVPRRIVDSNVITFMLDHDLADNVGGLFQHGPPTSIRDAVPHRLEDTAAIKSRMNSRAAFRFQSPVRFGERSNDAVEKTDEDGMVSVAVGSHDCRCKQLHLTFDHLVVRFCGLIVMIDGLLFLVVETDRREPCRNDKFISHDESSVVVQPAQ
mmetsp:Transcript_22488/g.64664  ORF Transcript_22488/g.64664 Transcript_22488/m.64664 type:complete len:226 (+) Transcript_22488:1531-2208(+)